MPYLNQVDALLHEANRLFAHAQQEAANWPQCGHLLARALEHATCAAFIAWDEPHAPEKKMHPAFDDRLAPHIDPAMAALVRFVWEREGQGPPDAMVDQLLQLCGGAIGYFADLAENPPPATWERLPIPEPVGWENLSDDERQFLSAALAASAREVPGVRLILFGSRAAGTARPDSDYDLLFIFPGEIAAWQRGQAIGSANSRAIGLGIEASVETASAPLIPMSRLPPPRLSLQCTPRRSSTWISCIGSHSPELLQAIREGHRTSASWHT